MSDTDKGKATAAPPQWIDEVIARFGDRVESISQTAIMDGQVLHQQVRLSSASGNAA